MPLPEDPEVGDLHVEGGVRLEWTGSAWVQAALPEATTTDAGVMSAVDKLRLDALRTVAFPHLKATGGAVSTAIQTAFTAGRIAIGDVITTAAYWQGSTLGGATYLVVAAGTGTDDGGSFINFTGFQLRAVFPRARVDLAQFGAVAGTSATVNWQAAVTYIASLADKTGTIVFPPRHLGRGHYRHRPGRGSDHVRDGRRHDPPNRQRCSTQRNRDMDGRPDCHRDQ